jgi:Ribosomal protein L34
MVLLLADFFFLFLFRQGRCTFLPLTTRHLHCSIASQAVSSELRTSRCKNLNLLQIIKSKFNYTPTMSLSQLIGNNSLQPSHPVSGQLVTQRVCRRSDTCNQLQGNGAWGRIFLRTKVRCYFPRPCEYKRIKRHGWKARLATAGGRRIIMRRILKGRHVITH